MGVTTAGLRVLLIVLLALAVGFFFGARYAQAHRFVPPVPAELAYEPPQPSPTAIVGLHDYAVPRRFVVGPAAAPGSAPAASPGVLVRDTAATVSGGQGRHRTFQLRGYATWYAARGLVASAGPALRKALGRHWRGSRVLVVRGLRAVEVRIIGWCACGPRHGEPTLLDLSPAAFRALAPLSRGVIRVTVEGFRP